MYLYYNSFNSKNIKFCLFILFNLVILIFILCWFYFNTNSFIMYVYNKYVIHLSYSLGISDKLNGIFWGSSFKNIYSFVVLKSHADGLLWISGVITKCACPFLNLTTYRLIAWLYICLYCLLWFNENVSDLTRELYLCSSR